MDGAYLYEVDKQAPSSPASLPLMYAASADPAPALEIRWENGRTVSMVMEQPTRTELWRAAAGPLFISMLYLAIANFLVVAAARGWIFPEMAKVVVLLWAAPLLAVLVLLAVGTWIGAGLVTEIRVDEHWLAWERRSPCASRWRRCPREHFARIKVSRGSRPSLEVFCTRGRHLAAFSGCDAEAISRAAVALGAAVGAVSAEASP